MEREQRENTPETVSASRTTVHESGMQPVKEVLTSTREMVDGDFAEAKNIPEVKAGDISEKQWLDLRHVAQAAGEDEKWIRKMFVFNKGNITCSESLDLAECPALKLLPEHLSVKGNLNLWGCTGLNFLPPYLTVEGNLDICRTDQLTSLPDKLSVKRRVFLSSTSLMHIPDTVHFGSDLHIINCTSLKKLPAKLRIGGRLMVAGSALEEMPKDTAKSFSIFNCEHMKMPEILKTDGDLNISGISITQLPENLEVGGNLTIHSTGITHLPKRLKTKGDCVITKCEKLMRFSEHNDIGSDLSVWACPLLQALPVNLEAQGDIDFSECPNLSQLPKYIRAGGDVSFFACHNIVDPPEELVAGKSISFSGCGELVSLPEELSVKEDLVISRCHSLQYLPLDLRVDKRLIFDADMPEKIQSEARELKKEKDVHIIYITDGSGEGQKSLKVPKQVLIEAKKRKITSEQWMGLISLARVMKKRKRWIDEVFSFGHGKITTKKHLCVENITTPFSLPPGIDFHGVSMVGCSNIEALPKNTSIQKNLSLFYCIGLKELPHNLSIGQDLTIVSCPQLEFLPEGLHIHGNFLLSGYHTLPISKDLCRVDKDMKVYNSETVKEFPPKFRIEGNLDLSQCMGLMKLPDDIRVEGVVHLPSNNHRKELMKQAQKLRQEGKVEQFDFEKTSVLEQANNTTQ